MRNTAFRNSDHSTRERLFAWLMALMMLFSHGNWSALAEGEADAPETVIVTVTEVPADPEAQAPAEEGGETVPPEADDGTSASEEGAQDPAEEEAPAQPDTSAGDDPADEPDAPAGEDPADEPDAPAGEDPADEPDAPAAEDAGETEEADGAENAETADRVVWRGFIRITVPEDAEDAAVPLYQDAHARGQKGILRAGAVAPAVVHGGEDRYYVRFWADDEPWFGYIEPSDAETLSDDEAAAFAAENEALIVVDGRGRTFYDMTPYFTRNEALYPKAAANTAAEVPADGQAPEADGEVADSAEVPAGAPALEADEGASDDAEAPADTNGSGSAGISAEVASDPEPQDSVEEEVPLPDDPEWLEVETADAPPSANLSDYLTSVTINAPTSDGKYVVEPGRQYTVTLNFKETSGREGRQFPNRGPMHYKLPDGLSVLDGTSGSATIKFRSFFTNITIENNPWSIDNGELTFNWTSDQEDLNSLNWASNAQFYIEFSATFDGTKDRIDFGHGIAKEFDYVTDSSVSVTKEASVDTNSNKIWYTLNVKSQGTSTNVIVTDTLSGTGITLDSGSISATNSNYQSVTLNNLQTNGNTFSCVIPEIGSGEIVTLRYSASIDPSELTMQDGKVTTVASNSAGAVSDGDPTGDTASLENTIEYKPSFSKSNTGTEAGEDSTTLTWTIKLNENPVVSVAGLRVTDTINESSRSIMTYSGDGLTVTVRDASGNTVRTGSVPWGSLASSNGSSWAYDIPGLDAGQPYFYEITYTTVADTSGLTGITGVGNEASTSGGQSATGWGNVGPTGPGGDEEEKPEIHKTGTAVDMDNKEVTWTIVFTVPSDGLTEAILTDSYPNVWIDGVHVFEKVKEDSVSVSGLADNESYTVNCGEENAVITFTQDDRSGLGGGSTRIITVTLKTEISDAWLAKAKQENWMIDHGNSVSLDYGDESVGGSDSVKISGPDMKKSGSAAGTRTEGGVELPVYKYEVQLFGVRGDTLQISDVYDTDLLMPYASDSSDAWYVFGGDQYYQGNKGGAPVTYLETATGININISPDSLPMNGSNYYTGYKVVYYLTVRSEAALQTLMQRAGEAGGAYKVQNEASWGDESDSADITYNYKAVTKELLTTGDDLSATDDDIYVNYRITLNPGAAKLNDNEPIEVTDTFSGISIIYDSIEATPSEGVSWDFSKSVCTFTIPDATKVVITYKARVVYKDIGEVGDTVNVDFSNTIEMLGYRDSSSATARRTNNAGGSASVVSIRLMKYRTGDQNVRLPGAVFQLFYGDGEPVLDKEGNIVTFTTLADGMITVAGNQDLDGWSLGEDEPYFLREIQAPEGYMLADFDYTFTITSDGTTDYDNYVYHSNDIMSAKNTPGTQIRVTKEWSDGTEAHEEDEVTVKLLRQFVFVDEEGGETRGYRNADGGIIEGWEDAGRTLTLNAEGEWTGMFLKLPLVDDDGNDIVYTIDEVSVDGYTATISGSMTEGFVISNEKEGPDLASVEVLKDVTGDRTVPPEGFAIDYSYTVDGSTVTGTFHPDPKSTSGPFSWHLEDIPVGTEVTFTESGYEDPTCFVTTTAGDEVGAVSLTVTIQEDGTVASFTNHYEQTLITVLKLDALSEDPLPGATLQLLDAEGHVVEEWVSEEAGHEIYGLTIGATYTLKETEAPEGYFVANEAAVVVNADGTLTVDGETMDEPVVRFMNEPAAILISKTDGASGDPMFGVRFQLLDEDGSIFDEWETQEAPYIITGLTLGAAYTLHEAETPEGYVPAEDMTIVLSEDGILTVDGVEQEEAFIEVTNWPTAVLVIKIDGSSEGFMSGVGFQLLDADGEIVDEWVTEDEPHEITGLLIGETYTLRETDTPDGYIPAEEITFVLSADGTLTVGEETLYEPVVEVVNRQTRVSVSKTDIASGEELAGATIRILNSEGNVVEEWTSGTEAHEVEGLLIGVEYTLKETVAPDGYIIAAETLFIIGEDGTVTTTGETTTDEDGNTVILIKDAKTKVSVSKVDIADGSELEGAHIQVLDSEGNVVEEWDSISDVHEIEGLKTGEEYTLREMVAPEGYTIATETTFTIDETGCMGQQRRSSRDRGPEDRRRVHTARDRGSRGLHHRHRNHLHH